MLTKERCDENITIWQDNRISFSSGLDINFEGLSPDEAELFAYRLLDAVKRAREQSEKGQGDE